MYRNMIRRSALCGMNTFAAILSVALMTSCSEMPEAELPASAGTIEGPSEIVEGSTIELKVGEIAEADIYRWYCDGRFLKDTGKGILIADKEGIYSVMGVNDFGEGPASPEKTVSLIPDFNIFINRLVGKWNVRERIVIKEGDTDRLYNNDHIITVTKIDDMTISISNFSYANENPEIENNGDTVIATVDNENETIQLPLSWKFIPTWYNGLETELCPTIKEKFADNVGLPFPAQSFEEIEVDGKRFLRMTMKTGDLYAEVGGVYMNQTYMIATTLEGQYIGHFAYYIGTEWTKPVAKGSR